MQYLEGLLDMSTTSLKSLTWPRLKKMTKSKTRFEELREFYENQIKSKHITEKADFVTTNFKEYKDNMDNKKKQQQQAHTIEKDANEKVEDRGTKVDEAEFTLSVKHKATLYQNVITTKTDIKSNSGTDINYYDFKICGRDGFVKKICEKLEGNCDERLLMVTSQPKYKSFVQVELQTISATTASTSAPIRAPLIKLYNTDLIKMNSNAMLDTNTDDDENDSDNDSRQSNLNTVSPNASISDDYDDSLPFSINSSDTSSIDQGFETETTNRTNTSMQSEDKDTIKSFTVQSNSSALKLRTQKFMKQQHLFSIENINEANERNRLLKIRKNHSHFYMKVGNYTISLNINNYPAKGLIFLLELFKKQYSNCKNCHLNFGIDDQAFFTNHLLVGKILHKLLLFNNYSKYWFSANEYIVCFNGPKLSSQKIRNIFHHFYESIHDELENDIISCGIDDCEFFTKFIEEYFECH